VPTALEETLLSDIAQRRTQLVILCGNAGDGKTALLQHLIARLGLGSHPSGERIIGGRLDNGPTVRVNLDGSAAWRGRSADELLDEFLKPFQDGAPEEDIVHLLAINDGRLLEWIETVRARQSGDGTPLTDELYRLLRQEQPTQLHVRFISLNQRSLIGGITIDRQRIDTTFLDSLIDHLYGGENTAKVWSPCSSCSAQTRCEVLRAAHIFGPTGIPGRVQEVVAVRARQRLAEAFQAVHLRGETHITIRELRAALAYILFGIHFCDDYHGNPNDQPLPYWDRAFAADSLGRQGELLREIARFDPALESHPQIDRYLLAEPIAESSKSAPRYFGLSLESARRRAFFEWAESDSEQVAGDPGALDLARGRNLRQFRELPLEGTAHDIICERLCAGISRLEDLPPNALSRAGAVPLRVTPRTPTESAFWVEKSLNAFRVEADLPPATRGLESLHRQAFLIYRYRDGREERLRMGADLFHLLVELSDGYQLGDISTDDTFAHLSIFVQRLVREDERELYAWNPMQDETVYKAFAAARRSDTESVQRLILSAVDQ
jgi:hypothetical protein